MSNFHAVWTMVVLAVVAVGALLLCARSRRCDHLARARLPRSDVHEPSAGGTLVAMINGIELMQSVHGEARVMAERMTFSDARFLDTGSKLARMMGTSPLPAPESGGPVLDEVFWATLLAEEGRPCRPRLLYLPTADERSPVHWLDAPVPLTRGTLRKLSPAQGPMGYLTWKFDHDKPFITGIQAREGGDPHNLIIAGVGFGAINITWSSFRVVTLRGGEVRRLSTCALPDAHGVFDMVRELLGQFESVFLGTVVRAIQEQGHGGSLWIVRHGCSLEGLDIGRRVKPDSRGLTERFGTFAARLPWLVSIARLAAVDGAVLLDSRVHVLGFATFVPLRAPIDVVQRTVDGRDETLSATALGGGRHRSAVEFCHRFAPAAAIVVSEDGRVMVIAAATTHDPPKCAEVGSLGFSDALTE